MNEYHFFSTFNPIITKKFNHFIQMMKILFTKYKQKKKKKRVEEYFCLLRLAISSRILIFFSMYMYYEILFDRDNMLYILYIVYCDDDDSVWKMKVLYVLCQKSPCRIFMSVTSSIQFFINILFFSFLCRKCLILKHLYAVQSSISCR